METNYQEIKERLSSFGKEHGACQDEYNRLLSSESIEEVMSVVRDNFFWCCKFKDFADILITYRDQFAEHKIWINASIEIREGSACLLTTKGKLHADSWGTSTINVVSWGTSTINARSWGTSTINAVSRDTSTIHAESWENSTIKAESRDTSTIKAESRDTSTINAESQDTSTINAESQDTSTMILFTSTIECQVNDGSIARYIPQNRIVYADASMKFERQP